MNGRCISMECSSSSMRAVIASKSPVASSSFVTSWQWQRRVASRNDSNKWNLTYQRTHNPTQNSPKLETNTRTGGISGMPLDKNLKLKAGKPGILKCTCVNHRSNTVKHSEMSMPKTCTGRFGGKTRTEQDHHLIRYEVANGCFKAWSRWHRATPVFAGERFSTHNTGTFGHCLNSVVFPSDLVKIFQDKGHIWWKIRDSNSVSMKIHLL